MVAIAKKFGQFKQWTGEKLGNAERSQFSEEFKRRIALTEQRIESLMKLHLYMSEFIKSLERRKISTLDLGKCLPLESLASSILQHASIYDTCAAKQADVFFAIGETQKRLAAIQMNFTEEVRRSCLANFEPFLESCKEFPQLMKKLDNRRLDYDAKSNALRKNKSPKPEAQEEVDHCRKKYEESTFALDRLMKQIDEMDVGLSVPLQSFVSLQQSYYEQSYSCFHSSASRKTTTSPFSMPMNMLKSSLKDNSVDAVDSSNFRETPPFGNDSGVFSKIEAQPTAPPILEDNMSKLSLSNDQINTEGSASRSDAPIKQVVALYDFTKEKGNDGELSIEKDQILDVMEFVNDDWLRGRNEEGQTGIFPASYVSDYLVTTSNMNGSTPFISIDASLKNNISLSPKSGLEKLNAFHPPSKNVGQSKASCGDCSCSDFSPNVFKKGQCNNCFHYH